MKEILFRGKTLTNKWVEGAYYKQELFYGDKEEAHIIITSKETLDNDFALESHIVIPETVGQYTGKMDKNGTKIFEGDVIAYDNNRYSYIVRWDEERCGFYAKMREFDDYDYLGNFWSKFSEVIGNIHDNPELLGDEQWIFIIAQNVITLYLAKAESKYFTRFHKHLAQNLRR